MSCIETYSRAVLFTVCILLRPARLSSKIQNDPQGDTTTNTQSSYKETQKNQEMASNKDKNN